MPLQPIRRRARHERRRGAMLVLIAICLPLIVIMAAFAVDIAWMQLVRTELRTATDAAARAGAMELSLSQSEPSARARAKEVALRNLVANDGLELADEDIIFGRSIQSNDTSRFQFTPGASPPNAVRVDGRRTNGSSSGPVDLLFAGVLGVDEFEPRDAAISTLLDRDICLVVDRSGSMMESLDGSRISQPNCSPPHATLSRWSALATAVNAFLVELGKTRQQEHVGLASYSSDTSECGRSYRISETHNDLDKDYDLVRNSMNYIGTAPVQGRTAISAGIDEGTKVLSGPSARPFAVKTMIVMTDGLHNLGREPILSAREAAAKGITIHTITFSSDADIKRMQEVAAATGGQHFHAPTAQDLVNIFKKIASTLPVMLTE